MDDEFFSGGGIGPSDHLLYIRDLTVKKRFHFVVLATSSVSRTSIMNIFNLEKIVIEGKKVV